MRRKILAGLMTAFAILMTSCSGGSSSSPSTEEPVTGWKRGVFKVEVTQEYVSTVQEQASMVYVFNGGDGAYGGMKDSLTGQSGSSTIVVSDEEARVPLLAFETDKNGLYISVTAKAAMITPEGASVRFTARFYLDGNLIGSESDTLSVGDDPVTFSSTRWVNKDLDED